jgi:8-oxo-dGTP pyrophosphatase MutT (NUDIX family)
VLSNLAELRARMQTEDPVLAEDAVDHRAAVALVLHEAKVEAGLELLMIMRAKSEGDRWSGDIAFPGGRVDAGDAGPREAAERETLEEVGLVLAPEHYIGRLPDLQGNSESIVVSAFVYGIHAPPALSPNYEVAKAFWTPVASIVDEANHVERDFRYFDTQLPLPGLRVLGPEHPVLWGLSYRFLELLMARLGCAIPSMPWHKDL